MYEYVGGIRDLELRRNSEVMGLVQRLLNLRLQTYYRERKKKEGKTVFISSRTLLFTVVPKRTRLSRQLESRTRHSR